MKVLPRDLLLASLAIGTSTCGCALAIARAPGELSPERREVVARAQVWSRTEVARMDLRSGPQGPGAFAPDALVECRYEQREMSGSTPKFTCVRPNGDDLKVKYGADNGEVYAEVAATRLLWALGFGADRMYPVRVRCHDCPAEPGGPPELGQVRDFDIAAIERKMEGEEFPGDDAGWAWNELEAVDPGRGGASLAERDALTLLVAVLQHTDNKSEQQRLVCLGGVQDPATCLQPFMLVSDLGKTFGKANALNRDRPGSVNLEAWATTPVWADETGCRANLDPSFTGTLDNPIVTDAGRRFLAELLLRLTDRQLGDLFTVARFPRRAKEMGETDATIDAWVTAFRDKVRQIESRSCVAAGRTP